MTRLFALNVKNWNTKQSCTDMRFVGRLGDVLEEAQRILALETRYEVSIIRAGVE